MENATQDALSVGDRVRIVSEVNRYKGLLGTVTRVSPSTRVLLDGDKHDRAFSKSVVQKAQVTLTDLEANDWLDLVSAPLPEPKIAVGDRVKMIKTGHPSFNIGMYGTVEVIDSAGMLTINTGFNLFYVPGEYVELAPALQYAVRAPVVITKHTICAGWTGRVSRDPGGDFVWVALDYERCKGSPKTSKFHRAYVLPYHRLVSKKPVIGRPYHSGGFIAAMERAGEIVAPKGRLVFKNLSPRVDAANKAPSMPNPPKISISQLWWKREVSPERLVQVVNVYVPQGSKREHVQYRYVDRKTEVASTVRKSLRVDRFLAQFRPSQAGIGVTVQEPIVVGHVWKSDVSDRLITVTRLPGASGVELEFPDGSLTTMSESSFRQRYDWFSLPGKPINISLGQVWELKTDADTTVMVADLKQPGWIGVTHSLPRMGNPVTWYLEKNFRDAFQPKINKPGYTFYSTKSIKEAFQTAMKTWASQIVPLEPGLKHPMDTESIINHMVDLVHDANVAKGWYKDPTTGEDKERNIGELLALIHSEISEALEGYRKNLMDDHLPMRSMIEVELADALIRIFDLAGYLKKRKDALPAAGQDFNLGKGVDQKLRYNEVRKDHSMAERAKAAGKKF